MRIAVNTRFLLKDQLEGVGWFSYEVMRRLVAAHPEHEFIFFFDRSYDESFILGENVTPVVLFPPARHPVLWLWWFEWSVPRALKKYQVDVFLSLDGYCSLGSNVPTVMVTHDIAYLHMRQQIPAKFRMYSDFFVPRYLARAERIVTVSAYSKQDILRHFPISEKKIATACNGVREVFVPLSEAKKQEVQEQYTDGEDYFFYIGSVHPRKNVPRLVQAFDAFKKETQAPVKLLIGGRFAWQTGEVKAAYDNAQFKKDILFLGFVPDKELPRLTGAALSLTYVSLFEGFGVPILEAMYCDVPVLTSNVTSMPEIAGEAGFLVNPLDVLEIAAGMQQLYENPGLRQDLVEKGRGQRQKFSWDKATEVVWENILLAIENSPQS